MDAKLENIISELSVDQINKHSVTKIIATILKDENPQEILDDLEKFSDTKETEIQQICDTQDTVLISSLNNIRKLTDDCKNARENVHYLQTGIIDAGTMAEDTYKKLESPLATYRFIEESLEYVEDFQQACELMTKAQNQIQNLHHVSALRSIEKLKNLDVLKHGSKTARFILSYIPKFQELIVNRCEEKFQEWVVGTRKISEIIGSSMFEQAESRLNFENKVKEKNFSGLAQQRQSAIMSIPKISISEKKQKISRPLNSYMLSKLATMRQSKKIQNPQNNNPLINDIDLSQLVQLESIYQAMGRDKEFLEKLKTDRKKQILMTPKLYEKPKEKFEAILGQLLIEKQLSEFNDRFSSDEDLQSSWIDLSYEILQAIAQAIDQSPDTKSCLEVKNSVVLFVLSLKKIGFSYRTYEFYNILKDSHRVFVEKLLKDFKSDAFAVIERENYWCLNNDNLAGRDLSEIGLNDTANNGELPFTATVPDLAILLKKYTAYDLEYIEIVIENIGEELFKTMNTLLGTINVLLFEHIKVATAMQTAFMAINARYFYKTFSFLYEYFESMTLNKRESNARESFVQLKDHCENAILNKIKTQLYENLRLMPQSLLYSFSVGMTEGWFQEAILYLENTIMDLENLLGSQLSSSAFIFSLDFLNKYFVRLLGSNKFNIYFVESLNYNVSYVEKCSLSRKMPGCSKSLQELKEIITLFLTEDFSVLKDMAKLEGKYSAIKFNQLLDILENFKDTKEKGPKKKHVTALAKRIKSLK